MYRKPNRDSNSYIAVWYEGEVGRRKLFADPGDAGFHAQARVGQLSREGSKYFVVGRGEAFGLYPGAEIGGGVQLGAVYYDHSAIA